MKPTTAAPIVSENPAAPMNWADEYPETPASPEKPAPAAAQPAVGGKLKLGFDLSRLGSSSAALPAGAIRPTGGPSGGQPRYNLVPLDMRANGTLIQPTEAGPSAPAARVPPPTTYGHMAGPEESSDSDATTESQPASHDPYTTTAFDTPAPAPAYPMPTEEMLPAPTMPAYAPTSTVAPMHMQAYSTTPAPMMYEAVPTTTMATTMATTSPYDSTYDTTYYASMF